MIRFNTKNRKNAVRMYSTDSPLGVACFMGQYNHRRNVWEGTQVGFAISQEEASRWLMDEDSPPKVVLFRIQ